jgi:Zn finger protein HypA/HybF involved in hydrogenase expression
MINPKGLYFEEVCMHGVIKPLPEPSLIYKCRDCGHKFKPLLVFLPKKCPICGSGNIKISIGTVSNRLFDLIVN